MGFKDTQWATTLELPMKHKVVLLAVCIYTDDRDHTTIAGQRTLADAIGSSVDKVSEALGALERLGIMKRERRNGMGGYRTSDRLVVNRSYAGENLVGESPTRESANKENSGHLPGKFRSPTPEFAGAEEINQIDQPEDQPDTPLTALVTVEQDPRRTFESFWKIWPRKDARKDAERAWRKAVNKIDPAELLDKATAYANHPHRPARQFVPYAASWLNAERWTDPPPEAPEAERRLTQADRNLAYVASLAQQETHPKGIAS